MTFVGSGTMPFAIMPYEPRTVQIGGYVCAG